MGKQAKKIVVSKRQMEILERLERASKTRQDLAERARIVILSEKGYSNMAQAKILGVDRQRVRRWRIRWSEAEQNLAIAEEKGISVKDLEALVYEILHDHPRSGKPPKFTPEQFTDLIALACEPPKQSGLPISHWTPPELAREAIKRGIVTSISPRHLDRFLKRSRPSTAQEPVLAQ